MTVLTTLDVKGQTAEEYRAILDELGVEERPEPGIYLHLTVPTDFGFRIIEIWDTKEGFESFRERRLKPALAAVGANHETTITIVPLHNMFVPRLDELPGLIPDLPGAPKSQTLS